jgi:D-beta-D-heptose 7-phosphate kinase/D-beta-D-heptose 1-phosphate adenosyltransferase
MTVVFTNGCFDVLHRGHIEYLRQSKSLGDMLIVGLNSDASVRRIKGSSRPVNHQEDRVCLLRALRFVDDVIVFDEDTPYELIKRLRPDIITKGGDYRTEEVVGSDISKVVILPYVSGYSTTRILNEA